MRLSAKVLDPERRVGRGAGQGVVALDSRVRNKVEVDFVIFVGPGLEQFDLAASTCCGLAVLLRAHVDE